ncbi:MAG: NUDIX hydrolase [archaeon]|jgi:8-oxo-dGTP pyrophosphatase MutT (NUDIX family)|nr:NUDIX hydrolase [archaeon]
MKEMTAALIIQDKKLLLVHNVKHNGLRIEPPGGKRKPADKTLEECVAREAKEELDIEIEPKQLLGIYRTNSPEGEFQVYMFISAIRSGSLRLMEPEKISKYGWYSLEEIGSFEREGVLVPNLRKAMRELKRYL